MNATNLVTSNKSLENHIPMRKKILKNLLSNIFRHIALYWDGSCTEKAPSRVRNDMTLVPDTWFLASYSS